MPSTRLAVGDCIRDFGDASSEGSLSLVPLVDCRSPHIAQVTALFTVSAGPWPGKDDLQLTASDRCPALSAEVLAADAPALKDIMITPNEEEWSGGFRTILCLVRSKHVQLLNRSVLA